MKIIKYLNVGLYILALINMIFAIVSLINGDKEQAMLSMMAFTVCLIVAKI